MNWRVLFAILSFGGTVVSIRDYYAGVFNKNDFLVAQDVLYQEKTHYHTVTAKYVRHFKCPISYYRVLDRLSVGQGPRIEKVKGGLMQNVLALRLTSVFNQPVNVVIYVACANKKEGSNEPIYTRTLWSRATATTVAGDANDNSKGTESIGPELSTGAGPADSETNAPNGNQTGTGNETVTDGGTNKTNNTKT